MSEPNRALAARTTLDDPRYRPMARAEFKVRGLLRMVPAVAFIVFLWFAAFSQAAVPLSAGIAAFVALVLYAITVSARRKRASDLIAGGHARTAKLLADGKLDEAAVATDATIEHARAAPPIHCVLLVQRAQLFLRLGGADSALALLEAVRTSHWLDDARLAQGASSLASALAMTHLVRGEIDDAEKWQKEAHAKIKEAERIQLLPLDLLIDARAGRLDEAATRIDEAEAAAKEALAPRAFDMLLFLRAFVRESKGEPAGDVVDADIDYVAANWPEMRAFISRHASPPTTT